ncbi:MAG: SDR family NAD(P)-dependent oxidoreductase [Dinoroseobacter sp.]|nr:SDR family NAD(P)-dependent oxidoreductase [Dinoroseobacter sp.]MDJ0995036.1 SDR family NAD(P)-dependent oxidoreductase [Dinoroseobacter sp.]
MLSVVTGASRGIGQQLAHELHRRGHTVCGTYRTHVPQDPAGVDWAPLDVRDPASHKALASALDDRPVSLLVCNAGVYLDGKESLADGYPPEMWADMFAVNVTGVFLTVQALMPQLQQAGTAKIAIISSQMASHTRAPGRSYVYRASKAAVLNLGRNLATDLRGLDIAVGIYHPGWVRTDMGGQTADISVEEAAAGLADRFDALSLDTTGCFETWHGQQHPY